MNDPFKFTNPYAKSVKPTTKVKKNPSNFIEAFKDQASAATTGVVGNAFDQVFGYDPGYNSYDNWNGKNPNQPKQENGGFNFTDFLQKRENEIRSQERNNAERQRHEEHSLYSRQKKQEEQQIEAIKQKIKDIIKKSKQLAGKVSEIEKSVNTQTVASGTYHKNIFLRLSESLDLIMKNINKANYWIDQSMKRQSAKSAYWTGVKQSGTKYMLSNERYMVTQTG